MFHFGVYILTFFARLCILEQTNKNFTSIKHSSLQKIASKPAKPAKPSKPESNNSAKTTKTVYGAKITRAAKAGKLAKAAKAAKAVKAAKVTCNKSAEAASSLTQQLICTMCKGASVKKIAQNMLFCFTII